MKKIIISGLFALTALTFNSCKKDEYQPKGDYQPKGNYGNASISSDTWTVYSWFDNGSVYYYNFPTSKLTTEVQNSGTVQVFVTTDYGTTWRALPYTVWGSTADYLWQYTTQVGQVQVRWVYDGSGLGSSPNTIFNATCQIKAVFISPEGLAAHPDTDYTNYNAIKEDFNLPN